ACDRKKALKSHQGDYTNIETEVKVWKKQHTILSLKAWIELVWNYTKLTKITIFLEYGFYQDN
ncbi:TPA: hypothetical protein ACL1WD_001124, partial [Streptococcus pneumoniae]